VGFSDYSKSPIVIVVCPLNALIECHMEDLKQRGISCTCLSGDGGDKDGALTGKLYAFIIANPEALIRSSMKIFYLLSAIATDDLTTHFCR